MVQGRKQIHGMIKTKLYKTWTNIRQKCYNRTNTDFPYYGAKGIVVCEEWEDFMQFRSWALTNGYSDDLILHRKDSNDDYCPENCEWITRDMHLSKRSKTGKVLTAVINGVEKTLTELSKETGISRETLKYRLQKGLTGNVLIQEPYHKNNKEND